MNTQNGYYMNVNVNAFSCFAVSFFNKSVQIPVTALQKRVLMVASLVFAAQAVSFAVTRYYFGAKALPENFVKSFFSVKSSPSDWALNEAASFQAGERPYASRGMIVISTVYSLPSALKNLSAIMVKIWTAAFALTICQIFPSVKARTWNSLEERSLISNTAGATLADLALHVYKCAMFLTVFPICCILVGLVSPQSCRGAFRWLKLMPEEESASKNEIENEERDPKKALPQEVKHEGGSIIEDENKTTNQDTANKHTTGQEEKEPENGSKKHQPPSPLKSRTPAVKNAEPPPLPLRNIPLSPVNKADPRSVAPHPALFPSTATQANELPTAQPLPLPSHPPDQSSESKDTPDTPEFAPPPPPPHPEDENQAETNVTNGASTEEEKQATTEVAPGEQTNSFLAEIKNKQGTLNPTEPITKWEPPVDPLIQSIQDKIASVSKGKTGKPKTGDHNDFEQDWEELDMPSLMLQRRNQMGYLTRRFGQTATTKKTFNRKAVDESLFAPPPQPATTNVALPTSQPATTSATPPPLPARYNECCSY